MIRTMTHVTWVLFCTFSIVVSYDFSEWMTMTRMLTSQSYFSFVVTDLIIISFCFLTSQLLEHVKRTHSFTSRLVTSNCMLHLDFNLLDFSFCHQNWHWYISCFVLVIRTLAWRVCTYSTLSAFFSLFIFKTCFLA